MTALVRVSVVLLAVAAAAPTAHAAFPGRNGAIGYAFSSISSGETSRETQSVGLKAERVGGGQERQLAACVRIAGMNATGDCIATDYSSPAYSPNGRRIVFDAGNQLALIGAGGAGLNLLPVVTANDGDPAFSPDGRRVVFTGTNDRGTTDVFVHRLGSQFARTIVQDADEPAWSSRNEIAWVRDGNVYVSNSKGRHRRFVTSGVSPDWSPDGGRLVVVRPAPTNAFAGREGRMFVVGARGRRLRRVFPRITDASNPVWSPNGRWLAFEDAFAGIYAQRLGTNGVLEEAVAESQSGDGGSTSVFDPAWRPRPQR